MKKTMLLCLSLILLLAYACQSNQTLSYDSIKEDKIMALYSQNEAALPQDVDIMMDGWGIVQEGSMEISEDEMIDGHKCIKLDFSPQQPGDNFQFAIDCFPLETETFDISEFQEGHIRFQIKGKSNTLLTFMMISDMEKDKKKHIARNPIFLTGDWQEIRLPFSAFTQKQIPRIGENSEALNFANVSQPFRLEGFIEDECSLLISEIIISDANIDKIAAQKDLAQYKVDFKDKVSDWDGFGVNYVQTAQTRDYEKWPEDYGGFSLLSEEERMEIIKMVFADDGLKPNLVKLFLDPYHEGLTKAEGNDNDDPMSINMEGYDHETTTNWMRYFVREGLKLIKARGEEAEMIVTMYGPAPWMTKQKFVRGRDLDPTEKEECAEYMISWAKYLREKEGFPVKYISVHNEGEAAKRWPDDGSGPGEEHHDHNMYWPEDQVVDFLRFMPDMCKAHGLDDIGITPGELSTWKLSWGDNGLNNEGKPSYFVRIANDEVASQNVGLLTSHSFWDPTNNGINKVKMKQPGIHAWTTSMTWGGMDVFMLEKMYREIYDVRVNGLIPWAALQRDTWIGGDPNPGTAFKINEDGSYEVLKGYYFYKQLCRAGRRGMSVARALFSNRDIALIAFGSNGTKYKDNLVVLNFSDDDKEIDIKVAGTNAESFDLYQTGPKKDYKSEGNVSVKKGIVSIKVDGKSTLTLFGK